MELFLVFTVPLFAYGVSVLGGTWAVKKFGGYPDYDIPYPTWNKAFKYALVAETFAFVGLFVAVWLLQYWGYALPSKPRWGGFLSIEIVFIWLCATIFANSLELFVLRAFFNIPPTTGLVFSLGVINALCSWPELAHQLKFI